MKEALGYFLTWTTYGTWLPGDSRGWVNRHRGDGDEFVATPSSGLEFHARDLMKESPVILDTAMRQVADAAFRQACVEFGWTIHALQVRSNHVHIVVTARDASPGKAMGLLKVRGTRALNEMRMARRQRWWTKDGSKRVLNTPASFEAAIRYVLNQDTPHARRGE